MRCKRAGTSSCGILSGRMHRLRHFSSRFVTRHHSFGPTCQVLPSRPTVGSPTTRYCHNWHRDGCYTLPELLLARASAAEALQAGFTVKELHDAG